MSGHPCPQQIPLPSLQLLSLRREFTLHGGEITRARHVHVSQYPHLVDGTRATTTTPVRRGYPRGVGGFGGGGGGGSGVGGFGGGGEIGVVRPHAWLA